MREKRDSEKEERESSVRRNRDEREKHERERKDSEREGQVMIYLFLAGVLATELSCERRSTRGLSISLSVFLRVARVVRVVATGVGVAAGVCGASLNTLFSASLTTHDMAQSEDLSPNVKSL